ncbi:MAG: NAD(P)/FAD-dependent oxidoreductase [Pseudobdellovibrio sp.]
MSKIFKDIKIKIDDDLEKQLEWLMPKHGEYRILRKSVDARQKHSPHFVYTIEVADENEILKLEKFELEKISQERLQSSTHFQKPIVVGTGPAGLFAAIRLVERGIPCLLFERGSESAERIKGINKYWRYGELDPKNNVCYGEGGAGLYSDGKLITRIKSPHIPYVLNRLVQFGAPAEIQWLSNPHVGSDKIRRVIPKIRDYLRANGCEIHFDSKVEKLIYGKNSLGQKSIEGVEVTTQAGSITRYRSDNVILATGHSAEDMLMHLLESNVHIEGKSFAMGLRIEHPQKLINQIQYREFSEHPKLGSANYKLVHHDDKSGVGVYSFCMCPGGYVLSSGTEKDGLVCNGMSNFNRNSEFANAAIVVSIQHEKLFGNDLLGGMKLRRELETRAYNSVIENKGTKELPAQNLVSFLNKSSKNILRKTSSPSGALPIRLDQLLPNFMFQKISEGLNNFNKNMRGFITEESQLYGVESRTSCPLRVTRDNESLESLSHHGLYPCGEGAGYAGGITSAAVDGIRCADKIFDKLK